METVATYLLKSSVWLTGFALIYALFLRNERFFSLNRIFLVSGILASIVFPLFTWHYTVIFPVVQTNEVFEQPILQRSEIPVEEPFPVQNILLLIYLFGSLYLVFRLIKQTVSVWKIIRRSKPLHFNSAKLIHTDQYPASFSFFSFVFVNPSTDETETSEIVNHEQEHIRQRHWIDLLLFEILCTMQWFNPAIWLYGRFIRQNHEYLADEAALQRTSNPAVYRAALLNQMLGGPAILLANSFNYSINKKRFTMMKHTIQSPFRKLKLLLVLPLIAGVFYAFAAPEYKFVDGAENQDSHKTLYYISKDKIDIPFVNQYDKNDLEAIKTDLAEVGLKIEYTSLKFTSDDKLSQISASIKRTDGGSVNFSSGTLTTTNYPTFKMDPDGSFGIYFQKAVTGKVIAENGKPLKGASVIVSGKTIGTITDSEGRFVLKLTDDSPLVISYVGFESQKVTADFENEMVITLKQKIVSIEFDIQASEARLKEQINVNESNALVIVDGKEIPRDELKNIGPDKIESIDVIKSKAAVEKYGEKGNGGVVLITLKKDNPDTQTMKVQTDSPMKFHSIDGSGKQPLIVIDGVVNKNQNANNISPETIESITVLKSESAKATYGEKGKNGVVMITTKKGASNGEKESVTNLSGNFVAIDFNDKNSASSGLNFSAKKIQGDYKNGVTNIKADTIVFDTNSSSLFFIDGKESTKAEVDRLDPKKIESINVLKGESIVSKYGEKGKDGVIEITTKMASEAFTIVEEMPQFPGGIEALKKYVASTLQYPAIALENGITGQVYVNFIVAQDGSITDAKIARRVDPSLDKEALRIVNNMPKWKPGSQAGKNVKVSYSMPIKFNIPEDYHPKSKEMLRKGTSRIGNINWINNTVYTSAELNKTFGLKKGDKYTKEQLQGIISGPVSSLYLDKGYVFSKIDIAETPMGDGNNNLTFTVYEGIRGKIGRIDVKGNKNVSSEDILRKIKIKPGDLFSKTKIIQSIEAINKMGKFNSEEIRPEIIPDSNNSNQEFGTVNIIFNVTEK